jgi:hypothetical protein
MMIQDQIETMPQERMLFRIGSVFAILGVAISTLAFLLGPMELDSHNIQAVMQTFASNSGRLQLHGLGISLGSLLILGFFVALQRSLLEGTASAWGWIGLVAAVVSTVINLIGATMGGSVMPALSQAYMLASQDVTQAAMQVGMGFYTFYEALLAPTFLSLGVTVLFFATALLLSPRYPTWLGWAAVIPGIWTAAGGVAFIFAGPMGAADLMAFLIPGFMLSTVWIFVVGIYLWLMGRR